MKIIGRRKNRPSYPPGYRPLSSGPSDIDANPSGSHRPSYDEMRIDSAIIALLANRMPAGATIPELDCAFDDFELEAIQKAVEDLARKKIVWIDPDGKVILGPPSVERTEQ